MSIQTLFVVLLAFGMISLASERIGYYLQKLNLPLISGFLLTGLIAGPYILDLIHADNTEMLLFLDDISLGVIAFAANSEFYLSELRSLSIYPVGHCRQYPDSPRFRRVDRLSLGRLHPLYAGTPPESQIAASLVAGAILV
ncbi:MAG: hypothetical protein R2867_26100 [Caldilineaceae bacterium]